MIDTLRSSVRLAGAALVNSEIVYSFLMGMGWFFLSGWAVALVVACTSVFRQDEKEKLVGVPGKLRCDRLPVKLGRLR